jgi:hypothetical protein
MECKRSAVMVRARWLVALALAGGLGMVAAGASAAEQSAVPAALTPALRAHVRNDRFQLVTSILGLPVGVRAALQTLFGSPTLDIAEPGARFQVTDVIQYPLQPVRRLSVGGCSMDHCLVYYERGGVAHSWHAVLFHWTPAETRIDGGGLAPVGLQSVDDVRGAVLSGALKASQGYW